MTCTPCQPGFYKAAVSTDECVPCPANTYVETEGSTALSLCQSCQAKSSTLDATGQSSRRACACDKEYYLIISQEGTDDEALSCQVCPKGAVCGGDGECALRNADTNFSCTDGTSSIVGAWVLDSSSGQYELTSCPAGYEMKTQEEQGSVDLQECQKCLQSQYIIDPNVDQCTKCPIGLSCQGDAGFTPVVQDSVWEPEGGIYRLKACPTGYSRQSLDDQLDLQQCRPCEKGFECTAKICEQCFECNPGHYKAVAGTEACSGCPQNTYRTTPGATELSFCLSCPAAATTAGTASTSMDQCVCSNRMYSTKLLDFTCQTCPAGAVCTDGSCALAMSNLQCKTGMDAIKGTWKRSNQDGRFSLLGCPIGHRLNNETGHDVQACQRCPEGMYMLDPNDPSQTCQACPMTATCPKRGPPVFKEAAIEGSLSIAGDIDDMDAILESLAATLGVDPSMIVLGDVSEARRGQLEISFQIFADESFVEAISQNMGDGLMESLASNLAKAGVNATISPSFKPVNKEKKREGEVWKLEDGVYILKSCPMGFLLINSTIATQTCKECEPGTYVISYEYGCGATVCDSRACLPCANGATCYKGSSEVWQHFVPKALELGGTVLPWVTVITGGTRRILFCDQDSKVCAPPLPGTNGMESMQEDHVWEFDEDQLAYVLKSCPPGHQLVNSAAGQFTPTLQQCSACGAAKYIIDREAPCMDCPKGAQCPDGAQFLPLAVGSVWEEVRASNGGLQKRLVECPAGYALAREEALAIGDTCTACDPGTFRLIPSTLADLNSSDDQCFVCDPKATCRGSDVVEADEGYWRFEPTLWGTDEMGTAFEYLPDVVCYVDGEVCLFPEGSFARSGWNEGTMRCRRLPGGGDELFCGRAREQLGTRRQGEAISNTSIASPKVLVLRCPVGACSSNNTCLQNRTGPVCGYCKPGFAMQTDGCSAQQCASDEELFPYRVAFAVIVCTVVFIGYLAFIARPVLPELDWLLSRALQGMVTCLSSTVLVGDTRGDGEEMGAEGFAFLVTTWNVVKAIFTKLREANGWAKRNHLAQFLKV